MDRQRQQHQRTAINPNFRARPAVQRVAIPTREQLLAARTPRVVVQTTPAQISQPQPSQQPRQHQAPQRVTMDGFQSPPPQKPTHRQPQPPQHQQLQQPQPVAAHQPVHHQVHPQAHHQPTQYAQPYHYQTQVAAGPQPVVYQQYPPQNHRPIYAQPTQRQLPQQPQHYQRAVMVAASQASVPAQVGQPALATAGGAMLPATKPKKESALKPYGDSLKNGIKKLKDSKIGQAVDKMKPTDKLRPSDIVRYAVVTFFVVMASYLAFDTWHTNQQIQSVFQPEPAAAVNGETSDGTPLMSNGPDYSDYQVPADQPRIIEIPKINLLARVKAVGLTASNKVDVPADTSFAGWYSDSTRLGEKGASFLTGHYNGTQAGGVFDNLHQVVDGDVITVEMGNGERYNYQVIHVDNLPVSAVDMAQALQPYGEAEEGINIMTCAGSLNASGFTHRLIVYTKRI